MDTNFLEFPLIVVVFRREKHEYSNMVVKVVEPSHTGHTVMPSPSDVYSDFLDRKNDLIWDLSKPKWKFLHTVTAVEKVEPLSRLNMQLKRVHDVACIIVDKG
jgi:hypothetical protein